MKFMLTAVMVFFMGSVAMADCPITSGEQESCANENAELVNLLDGLEPYRVTDYCAVGVLSCRSLVQFKDKVSGEPVTSYFQDRFLASDAGRSVALTAHFIQKADGSFKIYGDSTWDNTVDVSKYDDVLDNNVPVTYDALDYPTFVTTFYILGTDQTQTATLTFGDTAAVFTGGLEFTYVRRN